MRIRSIKPDFFRDELTGQLEPELALFYLGVCCCCDDEGRFQWNPVLIASDIDPYGAKWGSAKRVGELLEKLRISGRVVRYEVDGKIYGLMPSFKKHQKPSHPINSKIPAPPRNYRVPPEDFRKGSANGSTEMEMEMEMEEEGEGEREPGERSAETVESTVPSRATVLPLPAKGGSRS